MGKATSKDMFMQFASIEAILGNPSTTLIEEKVDTGLSIRGGLIWLIHMLQYWFSKDSAGASSTQTMALSTVTGVAAMPDIGDKGLIDKQDYQFNWGSAVGFIEGPLNPTDRHFLPPVPIASPQLVLYARTDVDRAVLQGDVLTCRICFTTAPLDQAAYTEIAEVWGW